MSTFVDTINRAAEAWWFVVVHAGWQSAIAGCALLAVVAFGKRWPSTVRYWLLVIALLKFAVPPLLSAPMGLFSHLSIAESQADMPNAVDDGPHTVPSVRSNPQFEFARNETENVDSLGDFSLENPIDPSNVALNAEQLTSSEVTTPHEMIDQANTALAEVQNTSSPSAALSAKGLLMMLHAVGTISILLWVIVQFRGVRRVVAHGRAVTVGPVMDSLQRVTRQMALHRPARVLFSSETTAPLALGVFQPTIVLPDSTAELSSREIDAILVHELAHLRRRDTWLAWMEVSLCAIWWFHPVVWLVRRTLRRVCEDCCDDVILVSGIASNSEYCDTLLRVARNSTELRADLLACQMASRLHPLSERFLRIMDGRVRRSLKMSIATTIVVAVIAGLVLPGLGRSSESNAEESAATASQSPEEKTPPAPELAETSELVEEATDAKEEANRFEGKLYLEQKHEVHLSGRATNQDGKPVAGAVVYVVNSGKYGLDEPVIGTTKTDADGRYDFSKLSMSVFEYPPQPVPEPIEGEFQVISTADGYGYTWRREMKYRPSKRPENIDAAAETTLMFYEGEPISVDLHFEPEVRVHGQITNDFGEPLEGAELQLGVIHDIRRGDSPIAMSWGCSYLRESKFADDGACGAFRFLSKQFLSAKSDAQGRYELAGIPRDASLIAQVEYKKEYPAHSFSMHTADGETNRHTKCIGYAGECNEVLVAPREIRVRVTEGQSNAPTVGVTVTARGRNILRAGSQARTGSDGTAVLQLAAGDYQLIAEPSSQRDLLRCTQEFTVNKMPRAQEAYIELKAAVAVTVQVLENGTGKPYEGGVVLSERNELPGVTRLQSQTVFVDNPVTDSDGKLHAFVAPGRIRFFAQRDAYSSARRASSDWFDVVPGKETTVAISLPPETDQKSSAKKTAGTLSEGQQQYEKLREIWHRQWLLCSRGRYRIRLNNSLRTEASREEVIELLKSCDAKTADECLAILAKAFPELGGKLGREIIIIDRNRMRGSSQYSQQSADDPSKSEYIYVFNGQETISYMRDSAQADIYGLENNGIGYTHLSELISGVGHSLEKYRPIPPSEKWEASIAMEGDRLKVVASQPGQYQHENLVDPKTGFVYRSSLSYSNGQSVNESWQFGPRLQPNGAVIPTVRFESEYQNGKLSSAEIYVIDEVELMQQVPAETFVVAVDAGTNVIDYRGMARDQFRTNERPRSHVLSEPVNDVVARANEFEPREPARIKAGDQAPAIDVAKWVSGDASNSAPQLDGKIVLVNFSAHWCGPCRGQAPQLEAAARHFAKHGVVTVGIFDAGDSESEVKEDVADGKLTFHIAIDKPGPQKEGFGKTAAAFGVNYVPQVAVIGRDGKIAYLGDLDRALQVLDSMVKSTTPAK